MYNVRPSTCFLLAYVAFGQTSLETLPWSSNSKFMQSRGALYKAQGMCVSLMFTNCSSERPFQDSKDLKMN